MLSFVINSIDAAKFASVSGSIAGAMGDTPYEIVGIHDARSMCDGYRRGLARSVGDPVVFCHDDIELLMHDLPVRLARHLEHFDVFAPVGTRKLVSMNWMDAGAEYLYGAMSGPRSGTGLSTGFFGGEAREVDGIVALEGVFIVARREAALAIGWDAETFDGWHGYDTDFSFRAHLAGWRVGVVLDLAIVHASSGSYDETYSQAMKRFAAKHAGKLASFRSGVNIGTIHIPMPSRDAIRAFFDHGDLQHWHRETRERIERARTARGTPGVRPANAIVEPASRNDPCPCGSGLRYKACHGGLASRPAGIAIVADLAPPESRNAPCPCGSGRRYKDCHGKVDAAGADVLRELPGDAMLPSDAAGRRGPDDIRWLEASAAPRALVCAVCGDAGPHAPLLSVRTMAEADDTLIFLRCRACGSGFYDPPGVIDFEEIGHAGVAFWRFYVEVGGGVWETIWPLLAARGPRGRSLLDIGCGFGFAVDFWGRETGGEAIGVELADYGRIGAEHLGVVVYDRLLDDIPELVGRRFDVVYASEVVEHVPDPVAFVALLSNYVADDGVLVLTTPAMSFIARDNHSPTLHAALAPGFHGFLLSAESFAAAARRAGFAHVDVRTFGERMMLWASRRPLDIEVTVSRMMPPYLAYLDRRIAEGDPASPVWQGLAYRAVKERVNTERAAEAMPLARRLLDAMAAVFGEHVRDPGEAAKVMAGAADMSALGQVIPFFLPCLYFSLGMIALKVDRDAAAGLRWLEGSLACTAEATRIHATLFLEAVSLVWPARASIAEVAIALGDAERGAKILATLCREGDISTPAHSYAKASLDLIEHRAPAAAVLLAERGHAAAARTIVGGYADYLVRRYGERWLTLQGVEQALASGLPAPADPLFVPWLDAVLGLVERRPGAASRALAVAEAADRLASREPHRARLRAQAAALRRRLAATSNVP